MIDERETFFVKPNCLFTHRTVNSCLRRLFIDLFFKQCKQVNLLLVVESSFSLSFFACRNPPDILRRGTVVPYDLTDEPFEVNQGANYLDHCSRLACCV